jgi:transcriptional regulator GlxA family with amidase domain
MSAPSGAQLDAIQKQLARMIRADIIEYYPRFRRVRAYVEQHLGEKITLSHVARVACVERKYFSTIFRRRVGVPFHRWLRSLRIKRALELISQSEFGVYELAHLVGFQEVRTFERAFKDMTNMTPLEAKRYFVLQKAHMR